jgi:hypothetical protein
MQQIQFVATSPQELKKEIIVDVKVILDDFLKNFKPKLPNEYLTRAEVSKMLSVDISTVHNYCKRNILQPKGIGGRVYFLRSEVEASIKPLNV